MCSAAAPLAELHLATAAARVLKLRRGQRQARVAAHLHEHARSQCQRGSNREGAAEACCDIMFIPSACICVVSSTSSGALRIVIMPQAAGSCMLPDAHCRHAT